MKKVILIDDEPMALESIKAGVDWKKLGAEVCAEFTNALEALDYVRENSVDIVITDINMPPFNGLVLCTRLQKLCPSVRFIIISGHADFAYAQKALQFGAVGYCLKPIDYNELSDYLKKAVGEPSAAPAYDFIESLYENNKPQLSEFLTENGIAEPFWTAVSVGQDCLSDMLDGFCCSIGLREYLYISNSELPKLLTESALAERKLKGVAVGNEPIDCSELRDKAFQLMYDAYQFFFYPDRLVFDASCAYCDGLSDEVRRLLSKPSELEAVLPTYKGKINHIFQATELYNMIYQAVGGDGNLYTYKQLAFDYKDYDAMTEGLTELVRGANAVTDVPESSNKSFLNIIKYIHSNYTSDISIKTIADQFYMNPCYISQLFKKETGKTFVKYLTSLRMGKAEELLDGTDFTVNRISEECGFNDMFYFIKTFKKYSGKTPSEFRKRNADI